MNACIEDLNQAADLVKSVEFNQALQEMSKYFTMLSWCEICMKFSILKTHLEFWVW